MAGTHRDRSDLIVLLLLTGPFFLNDFANIFIRDWPLWLFIDYFSTKLFPALIISFLLARKTLKFSDIGLVSESLVSFLSTFLLTISVAIFIDQNAYYILASLPGYPSMGGIPIINSPFWKWFDLTVGLLLVGVFEELIFRGYMLTVISRFSRKPSVIVIISSVTFGLIHWSLGLHAVVITAVIGAVFMIAYLRTRSLPAIMLAHFFVNFIDYAGFIPKEIFRIG